MGLAITETVNDAELREKFAYVSKETERAANLYFNFFDIENDLNNRHDKHMEYRNWIHRQKVKYLKEFMKSFIADRRANENDSNL